MDQDPVVTASDGAALVRVTTRPRAPRDELAGLHGGALRLRVQAPPEKGKANAAVAELLARLLRVPRRDVTLASGPAARDKLFRVAGLAPEEVRARLAALLC